MNVTIVDYGLGNVKSVSSALSYLNFDVKVDTNGKIIKKADLLIIPGVASYGAGVKNLTKLQQFDEILDFNIHRKPIIGLCLGAQLFLEQSEESPEAKGLGLIPGVNKKLDPNSGTTPNQGWSKINFTNNTSLSSRCQGKYFYFSHSYKMEVKNSTHIVAKTAQKGGEITAIVQKDNLIGLQFHPERSGLDGLRLLFEIIKNQLGKNNDF